METLLNGTQYSDSFKAYQCGTCVKLSTVEMLTQRKGYPDEMGIYTCPHCGVPMVQVEVQDLLTRKTI